MSRILYGGLLLVVALAQATIVPAYNPIALQPNVALVMLLVWSALRGLPEGLTWGFALGILFDVLAIDPLGTNALALLPVVLLAGAARRRFFQSNVIFPMLLAVVATVVHGVVLLLLRGSAADAIPLSTLFRFVLLQALLNAIIVPPLYLVAAAMNRRISLQRRRYTR